MAEDHSKFAVQGLGLLGIRGLGSEVYYNWKMTSKGVILHSLLSRGSWPRFHVFLKELTSHASSSADGSQKIIQKTTGPVLVARPQNLGPGPTAWLLETCSLQCFTQAWKLPGFFRAEFWKTIMEAAQKVWGRGWVSAAASALRQTQFTRTVIQARFLQLSTNLIFLCGCAPFLSFRFGTNYSTFASLPASAPVQSKSSAFLRQKLRSRRPQVQGPTEACSPDVRTWPEANG